MRQILFNRGYATKEEAEAFLACAPPEVTDPNILNGMTAAVERLTQAIQLGETVVVYGEYDADGVTASALLFQTLSAMGCRVEVYLPDRFEEGYGLKNHALDKLRTKGTNVIVTVDCGIRAVEQAKYAISLGMDLIITDHHTPGSEIPEAIAVINPKRPDEFYPFKQLAGVGVAYKLACALIDRVKPDTIVAEDLLDLVAIGTVTDLVPLEGENRYLVRRGLERIRVNRRQGLSSLMGIAGIQPRNITTGNIGFAIGPRLNAAGRLGSAMDAFRLLIEHDVQSTGRLAQELNNRNRERQEITHQILEKTEMLATADSRDIPLLFAADPDFNPGVVGLAASRLVDQFYLPSIVGYRGEDSTRASCRSIPEFHITNALEECADLLDYFGGHAAAAGFTVSNKNLSLLIKRLQDIATQKLGEMELRPTLNADAEVFLSDLTSDLIENMNLLEPTGYGNSRPIFVTTNLRAENCRTVGKDRAHLKLVVTDGWDTLDAIAFRQGFWDGYLPKEFDLIYNFEMNVYNDIVTPQLNVLDIRPSKGED
jgi:single-stranded-DNA-specific exonuclease